MAQTRPQLESTVMYLHQLLAELARGDLRIPLFRRDFTWTDDMRLELLRSVGDGLPIGNITIYRTSERIDTAARVGPWTVPADDAPPHALRTYVVDGGQRLTTLLCMHAVFRSGAGGQPERDLWFDEQGRQWAAYYDPERADFIIPATPAEVAPHWFPLYLAFQPSETLAWLADEGQRLTPEQRLRIEKLVRALGKYRLPVVQVAATDVSAAVEIFERLNTSRAESDVTPTTELPMTSPSVPFATGAAVRSHLIDALRADIVGPFAGADQHDAAEVLPLPPSRWYLGGFLAPESGRMVDDPNQDDEEGAGDDEASEDAGFEEPAPKQRKVFPASIGLAVLLPPGDGDHILARLRWAEYTRDEIEAPPTAEGRKRKRKVWTRHPRGPIDTPVPLDAAALEKGIRVTDTDGIWLFGKLEPTEIRGLKQGTRALSLFVVNRRSTPEPGRADEGFLFQVSLELEATTGFVPRPDRTRESDRHGPDEQVADLQYRDHHETVVGHGVAAEVSPGAPRIDGRPTRVRSCWLPCAEVRRVKPQSDPRIETRMDVLAALSGPTDIMASLGGLAAAYDEWIATQSAIPLDSDDRRETRGQLVKNATIARDRIARGVALLAEDPEVLRAFTLANAAMARMARQRYGLDSTPRWYLFQLAFVLLNLASVADPRDTYRDDVELIFFPTGGGKTEAYLGLIAYTLLLRRIRGQRRPDAGLGVTVILRYTLRLLTLDQLGRASTLICALELLRQEFPQELGQERLAIGLWVGRSATANTLADVASKVTEYKNNRGLSPFPLTECPWCRKPIVPDSLEVRPKSTRPEEVRVSCVRPECSFSGRSTRGEGLPILFVDEQIYRELPAFIISTVDKFAMLPWRGETGALFGRVHARDGRSFSGPMQGPMRRGQVALPEGLHPPELIVQDELHLISGPLGTMVGLYETAIEQLSTRTERDGTVIRPKIVASTATVRRAGKQIQALFGRRQTNLFPPPGVDAFETWFATVDTDRPGRLYIGVAASGRAMKAILLRSYVALLGAAAYAYDPKAPPGQPADAYMTLAGYFNSLRELGGMRRLVEDDVRTRSAAAERRRPLDATGPHPWVRDRNLLEPVELTSRESTGKIAQTKARLAQPHADREHVDVLLASNMISVGVDIDRLGLMVVAGQPKTTSEYIQASSRVGRQAHWPGLVVTCFNVHRPRDRSHYEHFIGYHDTFYRHVEATSLTPFSTPAIERGLAGVLTALCRLGDPGLTPPDGVMQIARHRRFADAMGEALATRAAEQPAQTHTAADESARLRDLCGNLLDAWTQIVSRRLEGSAQRSYSPFDRPRSQGKTLLFTALEQDEVRDSDEQKFSAPTSMRDVEPSVHLWVERYQLGGRR